MGAGIYKCNKCGDIVFMSGDDPGTCPGCKRPWKDIEEAGESIHCINNGELHICRMCHINSYSTNFDYE